MRIRPRFPYTFESRKKWFDFGLPFSIKEYESRTRRVREFAIQNGLAAIILHGDANENGNVRWFANFEPLAGSTFVVIPANEQEPILLSDSVLHGEPMHSLWWTTWLRDLRPSKFGVDNLLANLAQTLKEEILMKEGLVIGYVSDYGFPIGKLKRSIANATLKDVSTYFSELRVRKSSEEIGLMKKAAKIASIAISLGCARVREGVTEGEIAGVINCEMMEQGAHGMAFETMVLSGERTQLKHSPPFNRKMKKGEMVFIDAGSSVFGYYSDICRTLTVSRPSEKQRKMLEGALETHRKSIPLLRDGVQTSQIVEKAYSTAKEFGLEKELYVDGHGIGTSMFDPPSIRRELSVKLESATTLAYEPMILSREYGNISFEDDYLVRNSGSIRLSNSCPQQYW
ncbi:MAG: Xaa-Pro peptidase family protein [Thaumarchaeota archaeon]|nr:Xaa-Pro peptidase family protein [Nitrososphaerota archaeon]